ncbi:MAG: hypothetical protein LBV30_08400 [Propionibacteriaceae bacterium]|jgi:hypothetical protein|nr:hypothetical protein [Propionibacteriaceae bacterium]
MSGDVGVQQSEFDVSLSSISASTDAMTPSVSDVAEIACQSDTMRQYRVALARVEALLTKYKALLGKDLEGLRSVCAAIERMDRWVAAHMRMS